MKHTEVPDQQTEARDQKEFDEVVNSKGKVVLEWLAGAGIFAAVVMSAIALVQSGQHSEVTASASATPVLKQPAATANALASATAPAATAYTTITPLSKKGPEGKMHDAFSNTDFTVKVGQPLKIVVDNTDEGTHSLTSPVANVNVVVQPGKHTYTVIFTKAGKYQWYCVIPCDDDTKGWAMQHAGYMSGYFNVTPA
jgi:uncharacterized cupredoxin-like copper-binding protein